MQERAKEKLMKQDWIKRNEETTWLYYVKQTILLAGRTHRQKTNKKRLGQNLNKVTLYCEMFYSQYKFMKFCDCSEE